MILFINIFYCSKTNKHAGGIEFAMKQDMSPRLQRILMKKYEPVTMVTLRFSGNDIALKTDREGNPVLMFIGRVDDSGRIKGEQYVRILKKIQKVGSSKIIGT